METYYQEIAGVINRHIVNPVEKYRYYKIHFYNELIAAIQENTLYLEVVDIHGNVFLSTKGNKNAVNIQNVDGFDRPIQITPIYEDNNGYIPNMLLRFKAYKKNIINKSVESTRLQILCEDFKGSGDIKLIYKQLCNERLKQTIYTGLNSISGCKVQVKIHQNRIMGIDLSYTYDNTAIQRFMGSSGRPIITTATLGL